MPTDSSSLLPVLFRAWEKPFVTRSDFARSHVEGVAVAACLGLITVRHNHDNWGRCWRITATGLALLEVQDPSPPLGEHP
jgi:hypothetical protein